MKFGLSAARCLFFNQPQQPAPPTLLVSLNPPLYPLVQPLHTIPTVEMHNRMAMVALSDGSTILYNPIAPTEQTLREIKDSFGSPGAFVVVICFVVDMQTKRRSMLKMQDTLSHRVFSPFGRVEQGSPPPSHQTTFTR